MKKKVFFLLILFYVQLSFAQIFSSSNLPIVVITTDVNPATGQQYEIIDDPKVPASMKIIYRTDGSRNYLTDVDNTAYLNYNGKIGIEFRGSTSQDLPKKPYGLTTLKADGTNNNVSLLGFPSENDWILNSFAHDPSLMRDVLAYNTYRGMGNYASRCKYVEVVVNGDYKGLYVLMEKLKADGNRINITKITTTDNAEPNISGGYITKAEKLKTGETPNWTYTNRINVPVKYIHELPKPIDATAQQTTYIKDYFNSVETAAANKNMNISNGLPSLIDIPSYVDFMLMNEFASNVDAYQFSTFFHKDRGGKLKAGPVWDFNASFGSDPFLPYGRSGYNIWQFNNGDNIGANSWYNLFQTPRFRCYLAKRWQEMSATGKPMSYAVLSTQIDSIVSLISEAKDREQQRWGTVANFTTEISNLKTWIQNRINWMNSNISSGTTCTFPTLPKLVISKIHYNPAVAGSFSSNSLEFIGITNNDTASVDASGYYFKELGVSFTFPQNSIINAGQTVYIAADPAVYNSYYGGTAIGQNLRNLSNSSQKLVLADPFGNIVDEVTYADTAPWPTAADGGGAYLNLIDLNSDNSVATNWQAATYTLPQPIANFTIPQNISVGQTVTFTNTSQFFTSSNWAFNGGTPSVSTAVNGATMFSQAGNYDVTLQVSNTVGQNSITKTITVVPPSPTVNLALNKPTTTSSVEANTASFAGSFAVDGTTTTRWSSNYTNNEWIQVDLQNVYSISRSVVKWEAAYGKDFQILVSVDGTNWTVLKSVTNNTSLNNDFTNLSGVGRYIKLVGSLRGTQYGYSIYEFEVYGIPYIPSAPSKASNPSPANSATGVALSPTLSWTAGNETQSQKVYFGTTNNPPLASTISNSVNNTYSTGTLLPNTTYYWRVESINTTGTTAGDLWSFTTLAPDTTPPSAPTNLVASNITQNSVNLSWNASTDNVSVTEYYVYSGTNQIGTTTANSFVVTGLSASTTYTFTVKAKDAAGNLSAESNAVNVTTASLANVNLALNRPTTTSSVESNIASLSGMYAVDGNTSTRWSTNYSSAQWLKVDLGKTYNITKVVIKWEAAYGKAYEILTSNDNVNWTTITSVTNNTSLTNTLTNLVGSGRYIMFKGLQRATQWGYSIYEFEVYGFETVPVAKAANTTQKSDDVAKKEVATVKEQVSIYPNPAKEFIYLKNLEKSNLNYAELYDMGGSLVLKKKSIPENQLDIRGFADGLYILKVYHSNGVSTHKVLIKK